MFIRFLFYGTLGTALEILWTGANALVCGDITLTGHSSVIMFFIYGMIVFLEPVFEIFKEQYILVRIVTYSAMILMTEFFTGLMLNYFKICPWAYYSRFNIFNVIRLDYVFLWMIAGCLYEKLYFYFIKHNV